MEGRVESNLDGGPNQASSSVGAVFKIKFTTEAHDDLYSIRRNARARGLIESALARLESEGPCIGVRLRGVGRNRFCRLAVPEHAKNTWRVIYQWPPGNRDPDDVIWVWLIKEETPGNPDTDVYAWFDQLLDKHDIRVGPWSGEERRRKCCDPSEKEPVEARGGQRSAV